MIWWGLWSHQGDGSPSLKRSDSPTVHYMFRRCGAFPLIRSKCDKRIYRVGRGYLPVVSRMTSRTSRRCSSSIPLTGDSKPSKSGNSILCTAKSQASTPSRTPLITTSEVREVFTLDNQCDGGWFIHTFRPPKFPGFAASSRRRTSRLIFPLGDPLMITKPPAAMLLN